MNEPPDMEFICYITENGEIIAWCILQYGKVTVSTNTYSELENAWYLRGIEIPPPDQWEKRIC